MNLTASQLLRTKEPAYTRLRLAETILEEDQLIDILIQYPDLLQRPIVEKGAKAILARPAEKIKEIL